MNKIDKAKPLSRIVFEQFLRHRMATLSSLVLLAMSSIAVLAPQVCSLLSVDPESQNVLARYQPLAAKVAVSSDRQDTLIREFFPEGSGDYKALFDELVRAHVVTESASADDVYAGVRGLLENDGVGNKVQPSQKISGQFNQLKARSIQRHWLGTDELGRDVLARLIYGARISLSVAAITALASAIIGLLVGCLAGFYGGIVDNLLMRVTDAFIALPIMPLLIVLAAVDLKKIALFQALLSSFPPETESMVKMIVVLGLFGWMSIARLVRGSVLAIKESEYVLSAKTVGATDARLMLHHIVPNVIAPLLVSVTLGVGQSMIFESALSFLGLGIQPPMPSWGNMLQNAMELVTTSPFLAVTPGLMIFLVAVAVNFIGDGLRDAIDPKAVRR